MLPVSVVCDQKIAVRQMHYTHDVIGLCSTQECAPRRRPIADLDQLRRLFSVEQPQAGDIRFGQADFGFEILIN
jgi:hypothetical protein